MQDEDKKLIKAEEVQVDTSPSLTFFILLQLSHLILWIISSLFNVSKPATIFVHLAITISNIVLCQNILGRILVGLSWHINISGKLIHEIEPDPFVPTRINSNTFWIGLSSVCLFWISFTISLSFSFERQNLVIVISTVITVLYLFNLMAFLKTQRIASKQSVEAVKQVLLGKNTTFPDAQDEAETSESEEK